MEFLIHNKKLIVAYNYMIIFRKIKLVIINVKYIKKKIISKDINCI